MRKEEEMCEATITFGQSVVTCDGWAGHSGQHGGVYPGEIDGKTVDVSVKWRYAS